MIRIRKAAERGSASYGWLDTRYTFSFADYYDPAYAGFRDLRVLNDDRIAPGGGFPTHSHRDMEILTWVLEGELAHKDSLGHGSRILPGEIQRMSAGTGVRHSEFNASHERSLRLLQIWIVPERPGLEPGYEQKTVPAAEIQGRLRLVAGPQAADGAVRIHQDVRLYVTRLSAGEKAELPLAPQRHAWVQVAWGEALLNGLELSLGDGAAVSSETLLKLEGRHDAELLIFDLK
ncbi:MAG: pirin family protein [Candidatus Wallbacteria bacterium]|nr:pirin family protein [Candidatus Wallbacteria bacterium]